MKRGMTRINVLERLPRRKADQFNKVFNDHKERVRGLWERKGVFYAQLDANNGKQYKYPLQHAKTVPQALTEMQALKKVQREGKLFPPGISEEDTKKDGTKECTTEGHTIREAIGQYQVERDRLETKDPATCDRENSGLKKWIIGFGDRALTTVDAKMYKDYAIFCKEFAEQKLSPKIFHADDIKGLPGLVAKLAEKTDPLDARIWEQVDRRIQIPTATGRKSDALQAKARAAFAKRLNKLCKGECIYTAEYFADVKELRPETQQMLDAKPVGNQLPQLNRLLFEEKLVHQPLRHGRHRLQNDRLLGKPPRRGRADRPPLRQSG
jgi:hypothetical protein